MELPETIVYEVREKVAVITLNNPDRYNAVTPEMRTGIRAAFAEANADDDVWVILFQAVGDKAFCAGADLGSTVKNLTATPETQLREVVPDPTKRHFSDVFKPIIAAVNGICTAGGLEMLQGTDIRIASENARFGLGEVKWGIVPLGGSHVRLPRQIPWAVAMELLLTGDMIGAERAREIGLVNEVVPIDQVRERAFELAVRLTKNGPLALRTAKESVVRSLALDAAFANDFYTAQRVFYSEDAKEGPAAFKEKRDPQYKNR
ncbi:MAG: enoyl-CoA hydratase/isomerase family protein [Cryobacterium sp.]|nr:enoyl-CoA hydratase/isomerase family protein [Cryobacterium sp.]